ncbi:hypothetical protein Hanom_Chr12g01126961 [Helianthus anomalus]
MAPEPGCSQVSFKKERGKKRDENMKNPWSQDFLRIEGEGKGGKREENLLIYLSSQIGEIMRENLINY